MKIKAVSGITLALLLIGMLAFNIQPTNCGYSVQQATDGGYIIVGYTFPWSFFGDEYMDVYLVKTDPEGEMLWHRTFGGSGGDMGESVQQTTDGGYIIAGWAASFGAGGSDVYLVKTDPEGEMLWNRTYGGPESDRGESVQQTTDGGYIIAGYTRSFGAGLYNVYLVKTDPEGEMLWNRTYGGSNSSHGRSVQQTTDGGYIIAGWTSSFGAGMNDVYLVKTDAEGQMLWNRTYGGPEYDWGDSVQQTTDGGYIIAGSHLVKTDAEGQMLWNRTYDGSGDSVQQTTDGGYIIAGDTEPFGAGGSDVYLVKTDPEGEMLWNRTYGGPEYDWGYSVQQTTDGGYIIAGYTRSFGGYADVYLVKTDPEGEMLWNRTFGGPEFPWMTVIIGAVVVGVVVIIAAVYLLRRRRSA